MRLSNENTPWASPFAKRKGPEMSQIFFKRDLYIKRDLYKCTSWQAIS